MNLASLVGQGIRIPLSGSVDPSFLQGIGLVIQAMTALHEWTVKQAEAQLALVDAEQRAAEQDRALSEQYINSSARVRQAVGESVETQRRADEYHAQAQEVAHAGFGRLAADLEQQSIAWHNAAVHEREYADSLNELAAEAVDAARKINEANEAADQSAREGLDLARDVWTQLRAQYDEQADEAAQKEREQAIILNDYAAAQTHAAAAVHEHVREVKDLSDKLERLAQQERDNADVFSRISTRGQIATGFGIGSDVQIGASVPSGARWNASASNTKESTPAAEAQRAQLASDQQFATAKRAIADDLLHHQQDVSRAEVALIETGTKSLLHHASMVLAHRETIGAAVKGLAEEELTSLAETAVAHAAEWAAKAASDAAGVVTAPLVPGDLAAAAEWGAAAVAAGGAALALGSIGGGASAASSATPAFSSGTPQRASEGVGAGTGGGDTGGRHITINWFGAPPFATEAAVGNAVKRAVGIADRQAY